MKVGREGGERGRGGPVWFRVGAVVGEDNISRFFPDSYFILFI